LNLIRRSSGTFVANVDDLRPEFRTSESQFIQDGAINASSVARDSAAPASASIDEASLPSLQAINVALGGWKELAHPWYSDQIMPFDVTLSGATENGAGCAMKIFGVEILNEGYGTSIDDAVAEMQATFVARVVEPWSGM
jgi:hypothetical protein